MRGHKVEQAVFLHSSAQTEGALGRRAPTSEAVLGDPACLGAPLVRALKSSTFTYHIKEHLDGLRVKMRTRR